MDNQTNNPIPVTRIVVMITACVVTLVGVIAGLEPDVVLVRCVIACVATGCLTRIGCTVLSSVMEQTSDNET